MSKLTDAQLAEIAARHEQERQWSCEKHAEVSPGEPYSESGWCPMDMSLADVSALLNHIAAATAERDEANLRRAETVAMCDLLTAEREAIAKYIGYEWSPGSHYDLPEGVKDFVAGEVQSAIVETRQRAADAARVEREAVVKWLKQRAREFDAALETAQMTPNAYAALHTERAVLIIAADAISRNEHNQDAATRQE